MPALKLLLLENDLCLGEAMRAALAGQGFEVVWLRRLRDAEYALQQQLFDVQLMEPGLPDGDGLALLAHLRRARQPLPVLVFSARSDLPARLRAFDAGADDYLPKPFEMAELVARVRALARRSYGVDEDVLSLRGLRLHLGTHCVRLHGKAVALTASEFSLLRALLMQVDRVISRHSLEVQAIRGARGKGSNTLDVHMANLRRKIGAGFIRTVRGVGYVIDRQAPAA